MASYCRKRFTFEISKVLSELLVLLSVDSQLKSHQCASLSLGILYCLDIL